ncbi:hypothetical protein [Bradyrhizobium icense]|uniref:Uncharacterized protein n=1 Tax=Bradyrhizobium icense TaxID=1274631 RepID=A0A1B1UBG6_9BRAD|nr:hypothetical protein [Bradyrhizobium icense]ANW00105.1 hypothetical protein LMTR13_07810 [Bradyrhizobium icense]
MFDELRYRWQLRKYLKDHIGLRRSFAEMPEDDLETSDPEPRYKFTTGRELQFQEFEIARFRSKHLVEQAIKYHVPVPEDEGSWEQGARTDETVLTAAAAQKLRADIRAEQKADWDYWSGRVTLALALIGSIFGVLAYFKK